MSATNETDLRKLVNASGFLFQLRVEQEVEAPWRVLAREHPWIDEESEKSGYIDLIVADGGYSRLVIECKRTQEANWIFLVTNKAPVEQARSMWISATGIKEFRSGWYDCYIDPASFVAEFCVVRGQGENDSPMLERIASNLISSTESLAVEEVMVSSQYGPIGRFLYFPVIVTNANLYACCLDAKDISIDEGKITTGKFEPVPFIRFRKCLTTRLTQTVAPSTIVDTNRDKVRTVFIVQANHLGNFLEEFSAKIDGFSRPPW